MTRIPSVRAEANESYTEEWSLPSDGLLYSWLIARLRLGRRAPVLVIQAQHMSSQIYNKAHRPPTAHSQPTFCFVFSQKIEDRTRAGDVHFVALRGTFLSIEYSRTYFAIMSLCSAAGLLGVATHDVEPAPVKVTDHQMLTRTCRLEMRHISVSEYRVIINHSIIYRYWQIRLHKWPRIGYTIVWVVVYRVFTTREYGIT